MLSWYTHILALILDETSVLQLIITDGLTLVFNYVLIGIFIHSAVKLSYELRETPVIVSKIINGENCYEKDQQILKTFLTQIQYRNLNVENSLFIVDWKLLVAVSLSCMNSSETVVKLFQIVSTTATYLVITCQFDPSLNHPPTINATII
jgi:hypothetical protein